MAREKALVTPSVLRWARESQGLDIADAAERLRRDPEEVASWESGESAPTLAQARKLAKLYRRSLAVFFLPGVPRDDRLAVLPDFRRLPDDVPADFSPELRLLIRLSQYRQEWIREELRAEGAKPLRWVGAAKGELDAISLARRIRKWLGRNLEDIRKLDSNSDALRHWIDRVEARGAYVFQSGGPPSTTVDVVEARGFALIDQYAPFIMVNGSDSEAGRIFTLLHEVAHIWMGEPGVSNLEFVDRPRTNAQRVEQFCNRVAAEVLVPVEEFSEKWQENRTDDLRDRIAQIARHFRVSREVIARRALDSKYISTSRYRVLRSEFIAEWRIHRERQRSNQGGPKWSLMVPKRAGYAMTRRALSAFADGRLTGTELGELLNTKIANLGEIAEHAGSPWRGWGRSA